MRTAIIDILIPSERRGAARYGELLSPDLGKCATSHAPSPVQYDAVLAWNPYGLSRESFHHPPSDDVSNAFKLRPQVHRSVPLVFNLVLYKSQHTGGL